MTGTKVYEDKSNEELIAEYKKTGGTELKHEIILRYSYMIRTIAKQMRGVYVNFADIEDIINEGIITLMAALDKFDPSLNVKFESYASMRIRGSIVDLARKQDWLPRSYRKTAKLIDEAGATLYTKLNRHATDEEMAEYLGVDVNKYLKMLGETNLQNVLSLDTMLDASSESSAYTQLVDTDMNSLPEFAMANAETSKLLKEAILKLRKNEQLTISLYYRKDLNMREIAQILGVKEPRISQIHANAIRKLRMALSEYMSQ